MICDDMAFDDVPLYLVYDPGYRSSDCHLPEDQMPTIHDFIDGYTCDVRERPCRRVAILASNVTDDSSLSCRVTFVDVSKI